MLGSYKVAVSVFEMVETRLEGVMMTAKGSNVRLPMTSLGVSFKHVSSFPTQVSTVDGVVEYSGDFATGSKSCGTP